MTYLEIHGVSKAFGRKSVLDDVRLDVPKSSVAAVVGASGCGKTTLLRIIAGFEKPDSGSVSVDSNEVVGTPAHKRKVGYVAQDGALFPHLSVAQNVLFGLPRARRGRGAAQQLLDAVELGGDFGDRRPHELSGGQQQRVALARALALEPRVMLLDEPFSALDTGLRGALRTSIGATLRRAGVTTVLVTHDQDEALSFADLVAVMDHGRFTQVGSPRDVYERPVDQFTATYLGRTTQLDATIVDGVAVSPLGRQCLSLPHPDGRYRILLRPEQITATVDPIDGNAVVTANEYLGRETMLTVTVGPDVLFVRHRGTDAPVPGDRVSVRATGTAVVV